MTKKSKKQFENQSQTGYMQNNQPQIVSGEAEKKNRIKTRSQSGRSMIEMLGVLAIIAILSIGGIVGYKLAMNYYQADQIANEINLMRNDLKIKYALGNEELLLGDPYDDTPENENYSGHLSTQYDRYPVDYDCIRKDKAEFYNCRETDAYYIKVGNISKGVCKPLTTLVSAMDGLMYIEINKQPYEEDDLCTSDEANEFYIQFDAEDVNGNYNSNRPEGWCAKDEDCEGLSTPVCDKDNNECVECMKNADCASNICRKDHTCGECTKDSDCTNTETPKCNQSTNTCESCPPETPIWYNNKCVECEIDEDCFEKDTENPVCNNETNTCGPCPNEGEAWNEEQQKCAPVVCTTNAECFEHLDQNYYCDITPIDACTEHKTGICKKFELDLHGTMNGVSIDASAKIPTNYYNFCRICEANAGQDGADCSKNDYLSPYMLNMDFFDCADEFDLSKSERGAWFCHENATGNPKVFDRNNVSHSVQNLRALLGCPRLPDPSKSVCKMTPILAIYNSEYPCDAVRMALNDLDEATGEFGFCSPPLGGGRHHIHGGVLCKK